MSEVKDLMDARELKLSAYQIIFLYLQGVCSKIIRKIHQIRSNAIFYRIIKQPKFRQTIQEITDP